MLILFKRMVQPPDSITSLIGRASANITQSAHVAWLWHQWQLFMQTCLDQNGYYDFRFVYDMIRQNHIYIYTYTLYMYKYIYIVTRKTQIYRPHKKRWGASPVTASTDAQGITQNPTESHGRTHHGWNGGIPRIITRISHWYWWWLVI